MKQAKKLWKRILVSVMCLMLVFTLLPGNAMAAEADQNATALSGLEIAVGGNTIETATTQTLTPAYDGSITEYSTPILDYQSDKNQRFVWVKVSAPEGATVTAKCGQSEVTTLTSGEWGVVQVNRGYPWYPIYSGPLTPGEYNKVIITVTKEGEASKEYTVTVPMQPDLSNKSLKWKTDLVDARYITKGTEDAVLQVEAEYKNRPLENEDVITYQWYQNTTASTEGGSAIAGATSATYSPKASEVGTSYYYAVASCKDLADIYSKVIAITVTDKAAPKSVKIVCDYPYTIPNDWVNALGGVTYIAKVGDTLQLKAVDENGNETPVNWLDKGMYGGTIDKETGIYTITGTSYSYLQVESLYDATIKSEEKAIQVDSYEIGNKTPSVTLSKDGQTVKTINTAGGISNYTIWSYEMKDGIAECTTDLSKKDKNLNFNAMRPGTIQASFDLDLNGDGMPDGNGQTDSAMLTINGIAVEDASGKLTKTYLEMGSASPAPTVQLKALSSTENATFTWESANEEIATVDEQGVVTAKDIGSVIISANDGTYTGGIKVVVTSTDTPYFEQIDFTTTTAWTTGLSNATWKTANFAPTTLEYTGLKMTKAAAATLTLNNTTLYNTDKYTATAIYTDANGEKQSVTINSGATTELKNIPFDTNTITVTLTDKSNSEKNTSYKFEVTRPRDTTKTIANNGIVFVPGGRELWKDKYNDKTEGIMYVANEDGSFAQYQGVNSSRKYYRTYALNGLEDFSLTLKGTSAYSHIRISTDNGDTWKYLGQSGASGVSTGKITIPTPQGEENSVVKVMVQILDDQTYTANMNANKDGFADCEPNTYSLWVEQIPVSEEKCDIVTATTDHGDWYPPFDPEKTDFRMVVAPGANAPVLTFTVSDGVKVTVGGSELTPNENGEYTLTLTSSSQEVILTSASGIINKKYTFGYSEKESELVPDKVVDYLLINGQYVNGAGNGYGVSPQKTLTGGDVLSLGNFGGYITFYMENGLTDNPANVYGVDFYIDGNAFKDVSTGTGLGSMEPGQVWVSEDGNTWYALAGSEHYESSTIWNYAVTYTKTETGFIAWSDNQGNTDRSTHGRSFAWPNAEIYYMNDLPKKESFTLTGILLPCVDGTIAGSDSFGSYSKGARFGYVDTLVNGRNNPYLENDDYSNESSGFDLAWAVDTEGNPVDVSDKSFHYVKVVTASNLIAGAANEKSTEVGSLIRATAQNSPVGVTDAPTSVTISSETSSKEVTFEDGKQVYEVELGDMKYASIKVNGTSESDNIYINNIRVESGDAADGIKVSGSKLVRIIVQNGEKEPVIYLLKLTSTASTENELIENIKLNVGGAGRQAETTDGETYRATVSYRMDEITINPTVADDVTLTINGAAVQESYKLVEGENIFNIVATKIVDKTALLARNKFVTQEVTLIVTREKTPESTGDITVYFTMLGDTDHEDSADMVHTLEKGNLETWVPQTAYTVDSPVVVLDILEKVADEYGFTFKNSGNYISDINGLGEFDNGACSGWMYTLNGVHSDLGVAEQTLENGDIIVFHYTDDFTIEDYSTAEEVTIEFVQDLINAIGTVTIDSSADINAARAAYDRLSAEQKEQVTNYTVLTDAEEAYAAIVDDLLENVADIPAVYNTTGDYLEDLAEKYVPTVANTGGEWQVLGLERSGRDVSDIYYDNVVAYVKENINAKGQLHRAKSTDNSRVILGLTAAGYDPTNVAGYNLLEGLTDMDYVKYQGINGPIWALIALDSHNYEIPQAAAGADQVTREKLVDYLLGAQLADNGWTLKGTEADADITAMAIQALAPYYKTNKEVRNAVDAALVKLSNMQNSDGFYKDNNGLVNAESTAQVVVALTTMGIDPATDARFVKDGTSVLDALSAFYVAGGGFSHTLGGKLDGMSTEQGYYALVSYARMLDGQTSLYDMSDVIIKNDSSDTSKPDTSTDAGDYEDTTPSTNLGGGKLEESITELQAAIPFTKEELARVENGEDVDVWLEVSDISKTVPVLDIVKVKTIVKKELEGHTVCMYFDVNLFKQIGTDDAIKITELHKPVTIKMTVPEAYINTNDKVLRIYEVVRVHDGVAEIIETDFNAATNELSFETDCFSTYALTYKDVEKTGSPQTNDMTNDAFLYSVLLMGAFAGAGIGLYGYRKRQMTK